MFAGSRLHSAVVFAIANSMIRMQWEVAGAGWTEGFKSSSIQREQILVSSNPNSMAGFILQRSHAVFSRKRDRQHMRSPLVSQTRDDDEGRAECCIPRASHFENCIGSVEAAD